MYHCEIHYLYVCILTYPNGVYLSLVVLLRAQWHGATNSKCIAQLKVLLHITFLCEIIPPIYLVQLNLLRSYYDY